MRGRRLSWRSLPVSEGRSAFSWFALIAVTLLGCWTSRSYAQWRLTTGTVNFTHFRPKLRPFDETLPIIDFHDGDSLGPGVGCTWGVCGGFKLWASAAADLDFHANMYAGGNYQLAYQTKQSTLAFAPTQVHTMDSEFILATGFQPVGITKLTYANSLVDAYLGLQGSLVGSIGAKGCFGGCLGGSLSVDKSFEFDLLSIKNGSVEVLSIDVGSLPVNYSDSHGIVSVTADLPKFSQTFSNIPAGGTASYSNEKNVLKLSVDAVAAIAKALGLPPLKGSIGPVDYNLISATGWAGLNLRDTFSLTPGASSTNYDFSSPVEVYDETTGAWSLPTTSLTLPDGQSRKMRAPGALTLGILPTYQQELQGKMGMEAIAAVGYDVSALEVGAFGESIGPLFHDKDFWPVAKFGITDESLSTTISTKGNPLTLSFDPVELLPPNFEQTKFIPFEVATYDNGSVTEQFVRIVNATDPECLRAAELCRIDRTFPVVPVTFRPSPDPDLPLEFAPDFTVLSAILNSEDLIDSAGTTMAAELRELAAKFGLVLDGPPTDIAVGPGHPALTEPVARSQFVTAGSPVPQRPGDFDQDGTLTALDLNHLTRQILAANADDLYDLTDSGRVDVADRMYWIIGLMGSVVGDANLDGEFTSGDFVQVFIAGKYETPVFAGWEEGDWSGDGVFDSGDMIVAFQVGAYQQGPRRVAELVPEPASIALVLVGLIGGIAARRAS